MDVFLFVTGNVGIFKRGKDLCGHRALSIANVLVHLAAGDRLVSFGMDRDLCEYAGIVLELSPSRLRTSLWRRPPR